jgi:hypothetical protein
MNTPTHLVETATATWLISQSPGDPLTISERRLLREVIDSCTEDGCIAIGGQTFELLRLDHVGPDADAGHRPAYAEASEGETALSDALTDGCMSVRLSIASLLETLADLVLEAGATALPVHGQPNRADLEALLLDARGFIEALSDYLREEA